MSTDFISLGIRPEVNACLKDIGIVEPTQIQVKAIPVLRSGKDLVAQSQTGTGKTLAFLLPILESIDLNKSYTQALIITPTRELALQISKEAKKLAEKFDIKVAAVYGGHTLDKQINQLRENAHIVVGTPGRILDHVRRETLNLGGVTKLVLDEADQMLHMGFLEEIEDVIRRTSSNRQTMLFSATIPAKIRSLADKYMRRPIDIRIQSQNITLDAINQIILETTLDNKLDKLCEMIDEYRPYLAMVFCHTKQRAISLGLALAQRGYQVDELHGDLSQSKREQVMRKFRDAKLQILVATDIAARGLDIEGITHVFNYDIPRDADTYIHRIGRTGRAGQTGTAVTFVVPGEQLFLRLIEQGINASIKRQKSYKAKEANDKTSLKKSTGKSTEKKAISTPYDPKKSKTKRASAHGGANLRSRRKPKIEESADAKKHSGVRRKSSGRGKSL
ncbi:DEAD/DEAH box helicase [Dendrosporobacter sp. 1207_IL3150]|uniref:DEAD/DEAH box helicase n=1 Tax=Dendrosporobacter sp. 1207_IL3150 TaxID=3084054 RepID=UPI002FDA3AF4